MKLNIPVDVLLKYQQGLTLSTKDQRVLYDFVTDSTRRTWHQHFKRQRANWLSSVEIQDSVPLAFLEYMKNRKSSRCITSVAGKRVYYCDLTQPPEYYSPVASYIAWKRQFPRVLTALTASYCGVSLLPADRGYYPMPIQVMLPQMMELHQATVLLRQLHKKNGEELYSARSSQYLHEVVGMMVNKNTTSRVAARRVMVINAAIDMLGYRIQENVHFTKYKEYQDYE